MGNNVKKIKRLIIFTIMIFQMLYANITNTHALEINFKNIKVEDGLSQSTVEAIYQDTRGYIWIGTNDGLNKYNGYEFEIYKHNNKSKSSIANNYIVDIKEDKQGNIWVGTAHGLSKIEFKTDKITNYYAEDNKGNLSHNNIGDILITDNNDIIVGTTNGINVYDEEQDKFVRILDKEGNLTSQYIYSMTLDKDDNLWIGTKNGLNKVDSKNNNINHYYNTEDESTISSNNVYKVYYDNDGYLWVGTFDNGLNKIDIKTDKITRYISNSEEKNSIPGNYIRDIFKDSNNRLWIATDKGLAKINEDDKTFTSYKSNIYDKNGLVDDEINAIAQDKSGLVWIGTYSGISIFNPNNTVVHYKTNPIKENSLIDNVVHGIYEDSDGYLWVGTNSKGLNIIDLKNDNIYYLNKENSDGKLSDDRINDIVGKGNEIYIATSNGLNIINKNEKTIEVFNKSDGLEDNIITSIFLDSKNHLWIGLTNGVNILNIETKEIISLTKTLEKNNIDKMYTKEIYEDSEGVYWLGCFINNGLIKIDPNENTIKSYNYVEEDENTISSSTVRCITEDLDKNLWIGTSYGINKFDRQSETFIRYTDADGLANNTVYGILPDNSNNLWISTNNGLSMFNTKDGMFRNFGITDGLQGNEFNGNAAYKNNDGVFFFGGINGLNAFEPSKFQQNNYAPQVMFDDITVNGKYYNNIDGYEFKYNENIIGIELFVPDYTNTKNITYYYMLEGINDEWIELESNYINNVNLAPGDYTLKVKARNYNGVETIENKMEFKINPPFYKSKLAYVIYTIIIVIIIINNFNRVKRLDNLVNKRTKQLSEEMERNNDLLNKVIKLEKSKNNYFINLSHELRTPLNVIYTTEQLITEFNKSGKGIEKEKLSEYMLVMRRNTKRLLGLINNLIDTAKIEQGKYKLILKKCNIVSVVEEAALSLAQYIDSKGINLIIDPEIEEKFIMCDKYEIERCIVNLISNASKFTDKGGKIEVGIQELGTGVKITVKDTGIGIEPKYHNHIFDRFNQIVDDKSEVKGGSGLGLTITKQIVDLHNGEIFVESEVGKGSTFTIILN